EATWPWRPCLQVLQDTVLRIDLKLELRLQDVYLLGRLEGRPLRELRLVELCEELGQDRILELHEVDCFLGDPRRVRALPYVEDRQASFVPHDRGAEL